MKNYRLYLVRHGVTQGNLDGIYMGSGTDQPLCAQGAAQLRALAARFPYPKAETVFSSPMRRGGDCGAAVPGRKGYDHPGGPAGKRFWRI